MEGDEEEEGTQEDDQGEAKRRKVVTPGGSGRSGCRMKNNNQFKTAWVPWGMEAQVKGVGYEDGLPGDEISLRAYQDEYR